MSLFATNCLLSVPVRSSLWALWTHPLQQQILVSYDPLPRVHHSTRAHLPQAIHALIALDGGDRLSYAEFAVFVTDPRHSELQAHVCQQAAKQLEGLGRRSFNLDAAFHPARPYTAAVGAITRPQSSPAQQAGEEQHGTRHEKRRRGGDAAAGRAAAEQHVGGGDAREVVSASDFLAGLEALGLGLSTSDAQRLVVRFDVHGDGYLSTGRFVAMVESSLPWTRALERLAQQEEADEEADAYLRAQRVYGRCPGGTAVSADIVEMARYIGIRVSSDSSLLWIAADALAAPLPEGWVMYRGQEGRWFYHNELTGERDTCRCELSTLRDRFSIDWQSAKRPNVNGACYKRAFLVEKQTFLSDTFGFKTVKVFTRHRWTTVRGKIIYTYCVYTSVMGVVHRASVSLFRRSDRSADLSIPT